MNADKKPRPREYWVDKDVLFAVRKEYHPNLLHVIEIWAYNDLLRENEELKARLARWENLPGGKSGR